jgi:glycerol kinase
VNTGSDIVPSKHGLLTTMGYQLGPQKPATYALEGSIAIAGMAVGWMRDQLGLIKDSDEVEQLAASVSDTGTGMLPKCSANVCMSVSGCSQCAGGVYFVPAFSGLLAPYWRDDARGVLVGITAATSKHHLARAILESMAFQTFDVLRAIESDAGISVKTLRVDGGATKNDLLMQIQACYCCMCSPSASSRSSSSFHKVWFAHPQAAQ